MVDTIDLFNKWVVLRLKNLDLINKHVRLVLTYIVEYSWIDTTWSQHANTNYHSYKSSPLNSILFFEIKSSRVKFQLETKCFTLEFQRQKPRSHTTQISRPALNPNLPTTANPHLWSLAKTTNLAKSKGTPYFWELREYFLVCEASKKRRQGSFFLMHLVFAFGFLYLYVFPLIICFTCLGWIWCCFVGLCNAPTQLYS